MFLARSTIQSIIDLALREDVGTGDITSLLTVPPDRQTAAEILAKQSGVIAGVTVARWVFETLDSDVRFETLVEDGDRVDTSTGACLIARLTGNSQTLLTGERVALNFLQRLSGIATLTARMVDAAHSATMQSGLRVMPQILDTRKTTPGLRILEKYAVRLGGGTNHRFGLYDAVLIKDNHIVAAGGIKEAVAKARAGTSPVMKVEVEVKNLEELDEALEAGPDIIMLDNMSLESIKQAVSQVGQRAKIEVSGGVNEQTIGAIAATGVDSISVGALTHSAPALDIAMRFD